MPVSSGGMGFGVGPSKSKYVKPPKGTKTVSAIKPGGKRKGKRK